VHVPKISDLTLKEWVERFRGLKKVNAEIMRAGGKVARARSSAPHRS
jgi:hypothetical protein